MKLYGKFVFQTSRDLKKKERKKTFSQCRCFLAYEKLYKGCNALTNKDWNFFLIEDDKETFAIVIHDYWNNFKSMITLFHTVTPDKQIKVNNWRKIRDNVTIFVTHRMIIKNTCIM